MRGRVRNVASEVCPHINVREQAMATKIRYKIKYRTDTRPKGGPANSTIMAESESDAIARFKKTHPKATEIVAIPG